MKKIRKLGILTGGGDCPGLNAVIRAVVHTAQRQYGIKVCGIMDGYAGLDPQELSASWNWPMFPASCRAAAPSWARPTATIRFIMPRKPRPATVNTMTFRPRP